MAKLGPSPLVAVVPGGVKTAKVVTMPVCRRCGLALCTASAPPIYIPFAHRYLGPSRSQSRDAVLGKIGPLLRDEKIAKAVYGDQGNPTSAVGTWDFAGWNCRDPALCSYLLDAGSARAFRLGGKIPAAGLP